MFADRQLITTGVAHDDIHLMIIINRLMSETGQERFRSVTHAYYRDADALLLVYDVTDKKSFNNVRSWVADIRHHAKEGVTIMLVGNKADNSSSRSVSES